MKPSEIPGKILKDFQQAVVLKPEGKGLRNLSVAVYGSRGYILWYWLCAHQQAVRPRGTGVWSDDVCDEAVTPLSEGMWQCEAEEWKVTSLAQKKIA